MVKRDDQGPAHLAATLGGEGSSSGRGGTVTAHPVPGVLTELTGLLRQAPADSGGALWRLTDQARQLDANVIRLRPGAEVATHLEADLDVLLLVIDGWGHIELDGHRQHLPPASVAWMPRGVRRAVSSGPDGLVYLTAHRRRQGLTIHGAARVPPESGAAVVPEGGEGACRLHRVCPDCGRLATEADARFCGRCGTMLPAP